MSASSFRFLGSQVFFASSSLSKVVPLQSRVKIQRRVFAAKPFFGPVEPDKLKEERKRLANCFFGGVNHLLGGGPNEPKLDDNQSLLCLQVIVEFRRERLEEELHTKKIKGATHEPNVKDLTNILSGYNFFWLQSRSMVLSLKDVIKERVDKAINSIHLNDGNSNWLFVGNTSSIRYTEVTLFVLANYIIDDEVIGTKDQLVEFLEKLGKEETKIQRIHVAFSGVELNGQAGQKPKIKCFHLRF